MGCVWVAWIVDVELGGLLLVIIIVVVGHSFVNFLNGFANFFLFIS